MATTHLIDYLPSSSTTTIRIADNGGKLKLNNATTSLRIHATVAPTPIISECKPVSQNCVKIENTIKNFDAKSPTPAAFDPRVVHTSNSNNISSISKLNAIKCIFLCEFHVTAGRKITVQVPKDYLSKDIFETVSRYVIPQVRLDRSFLSVVLLGTKILGYPIRIDHKQYARNAFYFNLCFIFEPATRTVGYEPVVRKLAEYLLAMELSTKLLSQQPHVGRQQLIEKLFTKVRDDINSRKMCMLKEGSTLIPLCVVPNYRETLRVLPHQAAALTDQFYRYVRAQWDLTTLRILPYIDGFNHINRITALADVALELVCDCIRHLVVLGVAVIVPVFQYSNVYRPTPKLAQLAKCRQLQRKCIEKCSKSDRQLATVRNVFRIFASMAHGATFGELCVRFNPAVMNINERQMVLFGQIEGLIRRVDKFPVTVSRNLFANDDYVSTTSEYAMRPKMSGNHSRSSNNTSHSIDDHEVASAQCNLTVFCGCNNEITKHEKLTPIGGLLSPSGSRQNSREQTNKTSSCTNCMTPTTMHHKSNKESGTNNSCMQSNSSHRTFYNGLKSFDEICCSNGITCQTLETYLAKDRHVIVLLK